MNNDKTKKKIRAQIKEKDAKNISYLIKYSRAFCLHV